MFFKRFYDDGLAQASYLIGCESSGEAVVVDPNRDIDQYLAAATTEKLQITHVTETHIHADFVSGSRELAERTGAKLLLSETKSAWICVSVTCVIRSLSADAAAMYWSMSRFGSTTTASPVLSQPMR